MTLEFAATPIPVGQVRDWFLLSTGVYTSTPPPMRQRETPTSPTRFALDQNQPNPFSNATTVGFGLPVAARVQLEIFDAQGRRVRGLLEAEMPAGYHRVEWDRLNQSGTIVKAGVYLYRLIAGSFREQKKMVLLP